MKNYTATLTYLLLIQRATAQTITYELPKPVTEAIDIYIKAHKSNSGYGAQLSRGDGGIYTIFIYSLSVTDNVFYSKVEKITNRKVRIGSLTLPLVTSEDLIFADLGTTQARNGTPGKIRVIRSLDSYFIKFNTQGKIVDKFE